MVDKLKSKLLFFIYVIAVLLFANLAKADWVSCYNQQQNRVYFSPVEKAEKKVNFKCKGDIFYQAASGYKLIEESFDKKGLSTGEAGPGKNLSIGKDRKLFISTWNDWSNHTTIMVLEPDFKDKYVKKHCQIINHGEAFSAKYDEKKKVLKILIRKELKHKEYKKAWEDCKI